MRDLSNFVSSFIATGIWIDIESGTKHRGLTKAAKAWAQSECEKFYTRLIELFGVELADKIVDHNGNDLSSLAGHDFWLTRNHHGAGFWDKDEWDEILDNGCKVLTQLAHEFGDCRMERIQGGYLEIM